MKKYPLARTIPAVLAVMTAIGMTASVATAAGPAARHSRAAVRPCASGQIVSWLNTTDNEANGADNYQFQFTNISVHACSLHGFPVVFAAQINGRRLGARASHIGETGGVIVVPSYGTATAALRVAGLGSYPSSTCSPTIAGGVRIFLPGHKRSSLVPFPFAACSSTSTTNLSIQSVT